MIFERKFLFKFVRLSRWKMMCLWMKCLLTLKCLKVVVFADYSWLICRVRFEGFKFESWHWWSKNKRVSYSLPFSSSRFKQLSL